MSSPLFHHDGARPFTFRVTYSVHMFSRLFFRQQNNTAGSVQCANWVIEVIFSIFSFGCFCSSVLDLDFEEKKVEIWSPIEILLKILSLLSANVVPMFFNREKNTPMCSCVSCFSCFCGMFRVFICDYVCQRISNNSEERALQAQTRLAYTAPRKHPSTFLLLFC